jgi:hypothetical protein
MKVSKTTSDFLNRLRSGAASGIAGTGVEVNPAFNFALPATSTVDDCLAALYPDTALLLSRSLLPSPRRCSFSIEKGSYSEDGISTGGELQLETLLGPAYFDADDDTPERDTVRSAMAWHREYSSECFMQRIEELDALRDTVMGRTGRT